MEDLLDLGEDRRRGSATSVRTDAGPGWGRNLEGGEERLHRPGLPREASVRLSLAAGPRLQGGGSGGGGFIRPAPRASWGSHLGYASF